MITVGLNYDHKTKNSVPDEYGKILLTEDIRDWVVWKETRLRYERKQEEMIKPVLLAPSNSYDGFLVIDGNHRTIAIGELERTIKVYIFYSEVDRENIQRLMKECVVANGGISLDEFVTGIKSFSDLIEEAELFFQINGELSLRKYLEQNK